LTIGEKISALRRQRGMSQKQLAEQLMISPQAVSRWEQDENMPDVDNILRLSQIFDVSTDYLLKNGETLPEGVVVDSDEEDKSAFSFSFGFDDNDDDIVIFGGHRGPRPRNFIIKNLNGIAWLTFIIMGLGWQMWHPGWIVLVVAWVIKTIYNIAVTKSIESIGFGGLAILIFFVLGFGWRLWHPGWLVFLVAGLLDSLLKDFLRNKQYNRYQ